MNELKLYFSLISGDIYHVEEDEVKNLDANQIPLHKKPNSNCKKCYGRFYMGYDPNKKYYIPCPKCLNKCVDWEALKEDPVVETPKTTDQIADDEFIEAANSADIEGL